MKAADCIPTLSRPTVSGQGRLDRAVRSRFGDRWPSELVGRTGDLLLVWLERARQRQQLRLLDEHLKRDLGLSQAAIDAELAKPFWRP